MNNPLCRFAPRPPGGGQSSFFKFKFYKMKHLKIGLIVVLGFVVFLSQAQTKKEKWKGQAPIQKVNTATRPIQYQLKKTYDLGNSVFLSNEFDGARLNGFVKIKNAC